jgi:hypothetical protein
MESCPEHGIMFVAVSRLQVTKQTDGAWVNQQSQLDKPTALSVALSLCASSSIHTKGLIQRDPSFYVASMFDSPITHSPNIIRSVV